MAKRTVVGVSKMGSGQKVRAVRKPIKKNDLAPQAEVDAVKPDLPLDVSDVEAASVGAGLGDGSVFSKMISNLFIIIFFFIFLVLFFLFLPFLVLYIIFLFSTSSPCLWWHI